MPEQTTLPTDISTEQTFSDPLPIRLAWFYKPPADSLDSLQNDYEFYILTHNDEYSRDRLEYLGVVHPILQYLLLNEIMNPGACDASPYNDQVAFKPGDYCWIQTNHPDWFLTNSNGQIIGQGNYNMMDSGNIDWQDFWLQRAIFLQEDYKWSGIFLDNIEASLSKMNEWGEQPSAYPDDASYQTAILNELKQLYNGYFHPNGRLVFGNIIAIRDPQVWLEYLQYLDGVMLENFATDWSNEKGLSPTEWEQQMQMVTQAQAMGKTVILVSQGDQYDNKQEQFALASYLLVNNGLAYFRYTNNHNYEENWLYSNQKIDLGSPLNSYYQDGQTWRRDFSKGNVIVDPSTFTAKIKLY